MPQQKTSKGADGKMAPRAVIQLDVYNHPGVMSHICGLFARRSFNLEGIAALPIGDGSRSRVWLTVQDERRIEQMVKQLQKLRDVIDVKLQDIGNEVFVTIEEYFKANGLTAPDINGVSAKV